MIRIIIGIIFSIGILFLEPVLYLPFGLSIFIIFSSILISRKFSQVGVVLIIITSILLDLTLKSTVGTYLLSFSSIILISQLGQRIITEGGIFSILLRVVAIYISLCLLNYVHLGEMSNQLFIENILPAVISYIVIAISESVYSNFNSEDNLTKIKL